MIKINYLYLLFSRLRNAVMDSGARIVNVGLRVFLRHMIVGGVRLGVRFRGASSELVAIIV